MKYVSTVLLCLVVVLSGLSCKDDDSPSTPGTPTTPESVSKVIRSTEEGTVTAANGASIYVPKGAVPQTINGEEGEMLFTIDTGTPAQFGAPATPPAGYTYVGSVSSMGPEGFNFAGPIRLSMPIPSSVDLQTQNVSMYDYNRQNNTWVQVGGRLNTARNAIEVDAVHLCTNMLMSTMWTDSACGAIYFNALQNYTFKACIESYTLKYPNYDRNFVAAGRVRNIDRAGASTSPPDGRFYWRLPQGDYVIDVEVYVFDDPTFATPPRLLGYFKKNVSINQPHFNWRVPNSPDYEFAVFFGDLTPYVNPANLTSGTAPCSATPSYSVGVGQVNVRLEWSAHSDLDLWVFDPCNNKIYFANKSATCQGSLGQLDLDNWCSNFVLGRPENIFWASNPPRGTYKAYVHYYADCDTTGLTYFTVRWWVKGAAYSYRGSITENDSIMVAQFTY